MIWRGKEVEWTGRVGIFKKKKRKSLQWEKHAWLLQALKGEFLIDLGSQQREL